MLTTLVGLISFAELGSDKVFRLLRRGNCSRSLVAFASLDSFVVGPRGHEREFKATYYTFDTLTNPAIVIRSMGLSPDALFSWFLHRHLPTSAPGAILAVCRDSAIVTIYHDIQILLIYRDYAKTHANPDTDGN